MKKLLLMFAAIGTLIATNSFADNLDTTAAKDTAKAAGKEVAKKSPNAAKDAQNAKKAAQDADKIAK